MKLLGGLILVALCGAVFLVMGVTAGWKETVIGWLLGIALFVVMIIGISLLATGRVCLP